MTNRITKCLIALALPAAAVWAQSYTAGLRGDITDGTGAAVPGASVKLTDTNRGTEFKTTADSAGRYVLNAVPPSNYRLEVEATGFKRFVVNEFKLDVQQQATLNATLEVGAITTQVEVTEAAPLLNTTIASLGQVVENRYILALPNIGRNSMIYTYLAPGIVGSNGRLAENNTNFSANGARNSTSDVLVDGVTVTNVEQNSGITQLKYAPSVDSVQEVKVQTNFFGAEYGSSGSAIVNMVTKSGTNEFHGTGFYFHRDATFNANSWFANRSGARKGDFTRYQIGGVVGGPIIRNKTFFFATYERTKNRSPLAYTATFPTELQRTGDFSQTFIRTGSGSQLVTIFNPFATFTENGVIKRMPFAGNRIPASMHNPIALKALAFFPKGNQTLDAVTNQNNWFVQGLNQSYNNQSDFKVDHSFTSNNRLTARLSPQWSTSSPENLFGAGNPAYTFNDGPGTNKTYSGVVDFTRTHSANTLLTFRYGIIKQSGYRFEMENFDLTTLGFPQYLKSNASYLVFPTIAPEGFTDIGTEGWLIIGREESVQQISGSMTKILGGHNLKVGAETRLPQLDYLQPGYPSGQFVFGSQITRRDLTAGSNVEGNGLASMLFGWGTGSSYHIDPWSYSKSKYYGMFVQDDWKITRKLTINLGFRYDFDIPRVERDNRYDWWDFNASSPIQQRVPGLNLKGVFRFAGLNGNPRSPHDVDKNNYQPRLGLAYAINEKTSIRAAYGIFYTLSRAGIRGHLGAAFNTNSSIEWTRDSNATQYATLANPYPNGLNIPPGTTLGEMTFVGLNGSTMTRDAKNPQYQNWNLSIQREVGWNSVFEINYTGGKGTYLYVPDTSDQRLNPVYWGEGRTALNTKITNPFYGVITDPRSALSQTTIERHRLVRPNPQFLGIGVSERNTGNSIYNAMQLRFEKRFSQGLTFLGHYTWSKSIDDASHASGNVSWLGGDTGIQNFFDLRQERSLSAHDIPHRLVLTFSYQLPVGKGRQFGTNMNRAVDAIIGGWEVAGFTVKQSGQPLTVTQSGGTLWEGGQRPNLVGDPSTSGSVQSRLNGYYNLSAFTRPDPDTFGSAARTLNYRAPDAWNLDFALSKNIYITERKYAQVRMESSNFFNTPTFGAPASAFGAGNFGTITGYASGRGPRNIQLGFKFYF